MINQADCSILSYVSVCMLILVSSEKVSEESTNKGINLVIKIDGKTFTLAV
jgi:hypothetical protein